MISVFFNCSSPYVGFRLLQADYVEEKMLDCTAKEMTPTGYKVFNSSGSYMLLGTFHGRKYFHTRESRSVQFDEQGRPIYNSVAFLAGSTEDTPVITAIAAYVFFNEEEFYAEMARYITLLDDGYTVNFKSLSDFLKRFEQGCQIKPKTPAAERLFHDLQNSGGSYAIDFIVRQSTWNYFVQQTGIDFSVNEKYNLSDTEGEALAGHGTVVFGKAATAGKKIPVEKQPVTPTEKAPAVPTEAVPAEIVPEKEVPEKKETAAAAKENTDSVAAVAVPDEEVLRKLEKLQKNYDILKQTLDAAERNAENLLCENTQLKEAQKKRFLLGLGIGIIGTILVVLMLSHISSCTRTDNTVPPEQVSAVQETEVIIND